MSRMNDQRQAKQCALIHFCVIQQRLAYNCLHYIVELQVRNSQLNMEVVVRTTKLWTRKLQGHVSPENHFLAFGLCLKDKTRYSS